MANQRTTSVPVIAGMREDLSPHGSPPGTLINAENVRFPISGEVESRRGTTALSAATSASITYASVASAGPDYMAAVPGGFVFGASGLGFRYDFGQGRVHTAGCYGNALPVGRLVTIAREELVVTIDTPTPHPLSQAVANGYICVLYSSAGTAGGTHPEDNGWFVQVYTEGGTLVASFSLVAVGATTLGYVVADAANPGTFIVLRQSVTDLAAAVVTVAATGATIGAFSTVATLPAAGAGVAATPWAACTWSGVGWALFVQTAAATLKIQKMAALVTLSSVSFGNVNGGSLALSCYANASYVYLGWTDFNPWSALARVYDTALALQSGGTVTILAEPAGNYLTPPLFGSHPAGVGTAFCIVGKTFFPGSDGTFTRAYSLTSAGVLTSPDFLRDAYGVLPVTMPFNNGMIWCRRALGTNGITTVRNVLLDYQRDRLGNGILADPKTALVTEEFSTGLAGGGGQFQGGYYREHLGSVAQLSNGQWIAGLPRIVRVDGSFGLALAEWVLFKTASPRGVREFGSDVLITGDLVTTKHQWGTRLSSVTDVQDVGSNVGLYSAPNISAIVGSAGGGSLLQNTNYLYRAVIERIDADGNRFRSAPSQFFTQVMGAVNNTNTLTVLYPTNLLRNYSRGDITGSRFVVHIYRTASVSAGSTGQQFQRCTPPQGVPFTTAASATYVDTLSDSVLAAREILYTDGGVLDNNHPPSCRFLSVMEDRIWLGGLWNSKQIQSSKILVPGEPPQFSDSPAFTVVLPSDCTGLAAQDGVLVAFCQNAIYAVQGFGPNDQGQGEWGTPRVVTRSTGCINELSILETSAGIFFQSYRGIELLPRGLGEPQFIGAPVQITLGSSLVKSAAVIRGASGTTRTARFCIGANVVLVYDLDAGAWSRDTYPVNVSAICDTEQGAVLAMNSVDGGGFGFLLETNTAVNDSTGDNPQAVASTLQWTALHPFGVAGQGRFTRATAMLDKLTALSSPGYQPANATLYVTVDGFTDPGKAYDMGVMQSPCYRSYSPLQMEGSAVVLKLTTAANGWRFIGWTLEADDMGGSRRMPETEQG